MKNTIELMDVDFAYLVEKLGIVDVERFIAMVKRESFDYTTWRRIYFDKMDLDQVSAEAEIYARSHPYKGKGIRV